MAETPNYRVAAEYDIDVAPAIRQLGRLREAYGNIEADQRRIGDGFRQVGVEVAGARSSVVAFRNAIRDSVSQMDLLIRRFQTLRTEMGRSASASRSQGRADGAFTGAWTASGAAEGNSQSYPNPGAPPQQRRRNAPVAFIEYDWDHSQRPVDGDPGRDRQASRSRALVPVSPANSADDRLNFNAAEYERREARNRQFRQQERQRDIDLDSRELHRRADEVEARRQQARSRYEAREAYDRQADEALHANRERIRNGVRHVAGAPLRLARDTGHQIAQSLPHVLGVGAILSGIMGLDQAGRFVGSAFRANAENENLYTNLRSNRGFGNAQETELRALAQQALRDNPTLDLGMASEVVSRLYQNTAGNMAAVRQIAPTMFRNEAVFLMRHNGDREAAARDSMAIMRGVDLRNTGFGTADYGRRYSRAVDVAMQLSGADPSTISGQNVFQGMLSAGVAADTISDDGLAYLARGMSERASNIGNQLRSFNSLFVGGHVAMSKRDTAYFHSIGLIGHDGQFVDQQLLRENPVLWIRRHLQEDRHGNALSARDIQTRMDHIQRQPARTLDQNIVNNWEAIQGVHDRVVNNDPRLATAQYQHSPQYALDRASAAFSNFSFAAGKFAEGPGIRVLDTLAGGLDRITANLNAHPEMADQALARITTFFQRIAHIVEVADKVASKIDSFIGGPATPPRSDAQRIGAEMRADQEARDRYTAILTAQEEARRARVERRATPNQPDVQRNGQIPSRIFNPH